jgi:hypothetical protein
MTNRKPKPERQPMPELVEVVNATGEKQTIPSAWLSHPVLSVGFRLPPSTRGVWAASPRSRRRRRLRRHSLMRPSPPAPTTGD